MTLSRLTNACRVCVTLPVRAARFAWEQTVGTAARWLSLADRDRVSSNVPNWVTDSIRKFTKHIPRAFGAAGDGRDQLVSVVILSAWVFATSLISAGATLVLLVGLAPFLVMAVLRMVPAVDSRYRSTRDAVSQTGSGSVTDRIKRGR